MITIGAISDRYCDLEELRTSPRFARAYAKAAVEALNSPRSHPRGLLALRALAEAYGGLGAVAAKAGINRESLYRSLSPKGNPTLKTLVAVVNCMGLRLSVVDERTVAKKRAKSKAARKAA
jgi:probable addiction module antidote protein